MLLTEILICVLSISDEKSPHIWNKIPSEKQISNICFVHPQQKYCLPPKNHYVLFQVCQYFSNTVITNISRHPMTIIEEGVWLLFEP